MYAIRYSRRAAKDARLLKQAGLAPKAKRLIGLIEQDPFATPPAFERLVGNLSGFFSRRINVQHRLVYEVRDQPFDEDGRHFEGVVRVLRMWSHYEGL